MSNKIKSNPVVQALLALTVIGTLVTLTTGGDNDDVDQAGNEQEPQQQSQKSYDTESDELMAVTGHLTRVEGENSAIKRRVEKIDEQLGKVVTKDDIAEILNNHTTAPASDIDIDELTQMIVERVESSITEKFANGSIASSEVGNVDGEIPDYDFDAFLDGDDGTPTAAWVYPLGHEEEGEVSDLLNSLSETNPLAVSSSPLNSSDAKEDEQPKPIPYGTLHADSALFGATSLNALIGRIEKKGLNIDPFEFTAVLSGETLMANGFNFPQIRNAMISGIATGDMAFRCVRGSVTNISFVFNDGTIFQQNGSKEKPLARIADQWGNPCIKGEMVDDVLKHAGVQSALAGVSNFSKLVAEQQESLVDEGPTTGTKLTGSAGKFAAGGILGGALDKTVDILGEQYESYYRAVYVAPGEKVTLLLKQNINIDYDPVGRKISYENFNSKVPVASSYY